MTQDEMSMEMVIEARDVFREFGQGSVVVHALRGASLSVRRGELVALRGRSGAGKTTLLAILAGLDDPTSGEVTLAGQRLASLSDAERARLRRERVGILFQDAHLFPLLTARENVEVALRLLRIPARDREERASVALERVGLAARAHHRVLELSGGEQQRVALARALAHDPVVLFADEPTGSLDSRTAREIAALLRRMAHERGIGMLVATHDAIVAEAADRQIAIADGAVTSLAAGSAV